MKNFGVFLTFKESLFEISHSLIFCNSLFTVEKRTLMSLCSKNRFVSPANIIVFNKLEALAISFIYIRNTNGPRTDPCGTLHVTFFPFIKFSLLMQMCYFLFVR